MSTCPANHEQRGTDQNRENGSNPADMFKMTNPIHPNTNQHNCEREPQQGPHNSTPGRNTVTNVFSR